jgi:DNA-binding MarR family transcriptional regulator
MTPAGHLLDCLTVSGAHQIADPEQLAEGVLAILRLHRSLECVATGLTPAQYRIMKLAAAGGERSTRLARRLAVAKPTLTAIADGLVAAGYAARTAEAGDRRVVRLSLTPAGRAALAAADAAYADWLGPVLATAGGPGEALDTLRRLAAALTEAHRSRQDRDGKGRGHEHATAQHGPLAFPPEGGS